MPFSHIVNEEKGFVSVKGHGDITRKDIKEHLEELLHEKYLPSPYRQIIDFTDVDNLDISTEDAFNFLEKMSLRPSILHGRIAFVADRALVLSMCNVFKAESHGQFEVEVFHTVREAESFLLNS